MSLLENYIKYKNDNSKMGNIYQIFDNLCLNIVHSIPKHIDIRFITNFIKNHVPQNFFNNVDGIYVVQLKEFDERSINAIFKDNTIYVTPNQSNEEDMIDDIVHELAHAIEKQYDNFLFSDMTIEREFLNKRRTFYHRLPKDSLTSDKSFYQSFMEPQFSNEMDMYFYKDLGYENVEKIGGDLFCSPYAITALREYWANCFEIYVLGDKEVVRKKCPTVFHKIENLMKME